jgi:hypothetical protein
MRLFWALVGSAVSIALIIAIVNLRINFSDPTSDGERVGVIIKLVPQGVMNDSWEAELVRGGLNGGNGGFSVQPFDFTVPSRLVDQVRAALASGQEVHIHYSASIFYSALLTDSGGHYLTSIDPLKKAP